MEIRIIGGGPAGLYFAALMKREDPAHDIVIYERGPRDATWGFGVVFSDRALDFLRADDEAMFRLLSPHMETWPNLTIVHNDTRIPINGNGFAAVDRLRLLSLLYAHVENLGVRIEFGCAIESLIFCATSLIIPSATVPGLKVESTRIGRDGYGCASAGWASEPIAPARHRQTSRRLFMRFSFSRTRSSWPRSARAQCSRIHGEAPKED